MLEHIDSDGLELYILGHVRGEQLSAIEEHLLVCRRCQDALDQTQDFVQLIRESLARPIL